MISFTYHNPTIIYFGQPQFTQLGDELKKHGRRVLLTYGMGSIKSTGLYDRVLEQIRKAELELFELPGIEANPDIETVRKGIALCKKEKIEVLLAVGGASTIDATKIIGAGAAYDGDAWDLVTKKTDITECLPIITVLTLAAAGSEMNGVAVISNAATQEKRSISNPLMRPRASFLDPALTITVSPYQTACGVADIIAHIMENYFHGPVDIEMLETVMEGFIRDVIRFGTQAIKNPSDLAARTNLMWISTWAQNAFIRGAKNPTWSIHAIEHELTAFYGIAHGHGLAILIPRWMEYVLDAQNAPRFRQFACNVFGLEHNPDAIALAKKGIELLSAFFFRTLGLKSTLTDLGIDRTHFAQMAKNVSDRSKSGTAGFRRLSQQDIEQIYLMCL